MVWSIMMCVPLRTRGGGVGTASRRLSRRGGSLSGCESFCGLRCWGDVTHWRRCFKVVEYGHLSVSKQKYGLVGVSVSRKFGNAAMNIRGLTANQVASTEAIISLVLVPSEVQHRPVSVLEVLKLRLHMGLLHTHLPPNRLLHLARMDRRCLTTVNWQKQKSCYLHSTHHQTGRLHRRHTHGHRSILKPTKNHTCLLVCHTDFGCSPGWNSAKSNSNSMTPGPDSLGSDSPL